jgi:hypothetical protein
MEKGPFCLRIHLFARLQVRDGDCDRIEPVVQKSGRFGLSEKGSRKRFRGG